LREAAAAMIRPSEVFSPVEARRAFYDGMFDLFLETAGEALPAQTI